MVYYHTSGNIKMIRNVLLDYSAASEVSSYEYMKSYIEKCPETAEDAKISWIAETFLGIQKHALFLKTISTHLSEELCEEDQDYFMIVFYAITFQIDPKDMQLFYKCLFNLSKSLLSIFTKFLGNNEALTFISHVAQSNYDTNFITEKIIGPLFVWQPYISEMGHSFAEYVKKIERRKVKPPTIPIQPNVLNRKLKDSTSVSPPRVPLPTTPPNSLRTKGTKKMLTKSVIDQKLAHLHEKNKQKATHLLNDVKTKDYHYAQEKSDRYYKRIDSIKYEIETEMFKPPPKPRQKFMIKHIPTIKETAASLKRMNKKISIAEQNELKWLEDLMKNCTATNKQEQLEEYVRQETERERLYDIERKHLVGQISHEEAVIAKKKLLEDNKKKYEDFLKEKEIWNEEIENWKKIQIDKNRKQIEKKSLFELDLVQARNNVSLKNKVIADTLKKESEIMLENAFREKQKELEKKINMIKEIKILSMISKKSKLPKVIDLTETSGLGLLSEMSIAELQERLCSMKIELKDELQRKKDLIKEENITAKKELEDAKASIKMFMTERAAIRKQNKAPKVTLHASTSKEISDLKKILEEKRKLRAQLTS